MALPRLVLTGASGFLGRHLLDLLKEKFEIIGLARRSQTRCGAPFHANISWFQVDIGDEEDLVRVFDEIAAGGGADVVIHLAAHYDFSGEEHPEYFRTNVDGLRNVLDQSRRLKPGVFVFSSSVAACAFPAPGKPLNEDSPPDGDHVYARTKAIGEAMLAEYADDFPSVIVRFAAMFSDWCEYPPLYMFLRTWLSDAWNARVLGGRGESAIPYMHVRDGAAFLETVLEKADQLDAGEVLIASPDEALSHLTLFREATRYVYTEPRRPIFTPRFMVKPGIYMMSLFGHFMREKPFEKPWMASYVDLSMDIDASRTRARLDWQPRKRLSLPRRLPFLLEHQKGDPVEWTRRNRDAMKQVRMRPNLKIHALLHKHQEEIIDAYTAQLTNSVSSYQGLEVQEHAWNHRMILRHLCGAIRTRERTEFLSYCQDITERRLAQGFSPRDLVRALTILEEICLESLRKDPEGSDVIPHLNTHVSATIRFGIDHVRETCGLMRPKYPHIIPKGCEDEE